MISPLPWRETDSGTDTTDGPIILDANGKEVMGVSEWIRMEKYDLASIILRVNAHDAIVSALNDAKKWLAGQPERSKCKAQTLAEITASIDAALSQARIR